MSTAYSSEGDTNSNLIERVDSGGTDESPFGSSLTTPVDEDVELFTGIEQRLLAKEQLGTIDASEIFLGHHDDEISALPKALSKAARKGEEFSEELEDGRKLSVLEALQQTQICSPTVDELSDAPQPIVSRPRSTSIDSRQANHPITTSNNAEILIGQQPISGFSDDFLPSPFPLNIGTTLALENNDLSDQQHVHTEDRDDEPLATTKIAVMAEELAGAAKMEIASSTLDGCSGAPKPIVPLTANSEDKSVSETLSPSDQHNLPTGDRATVNEEDSSDLPFSLSNPALDEFSPEAESNLFALPLPKLTPRSLLLTVLRTFLFLPWCVAVGGAIVLFPTHLELVAFRPGYISTPRGIRRFSFWAESGLELVAIFFAFLASVWWIYPTFGLLALGGVVAQCMYAWQGFEVDRSLPLGDDDRQSLYLVAKVYGLGDTLLDIKKTGDSYMISRLEKDGVYRDESEDEGNL
ncbi:hypothetical protein Hypma_000507 [Hypsizygus marmoreus]|uniref:Uncharacterized protein n=1 Tax=Hypsizygus marmoreus TaxID=39966 RepID=A0A369JC59_HYPMA|nr:hypothetical protein Hypma_000507 [Hypsizygus marmoreus]